MKRVIKPLLRRSLPVAAVAALAMSMPVVPAFATDGQAGNELPMTGSLSGSASGFEYAPGFPLERSTFGGRCSVPSDYIVHYNGLSGEASHLGAFTAVEASNCSQFDLAHGFVTFSDGTFTLKTANGDTVTGTYGNGLATVQADGSITYTDEWTISGGTGRFVGATGHVDINGKVTSFDMTVMPWKVSVVETFGDASISYDASNRSD